MMMTTHVTSIGGEQASITARHRDIRRRSPRRSGPMSGSSAPMVTIILRDPTEIIAIARESRVERREMTSIFGNRRGDAFFIARLKGAGFRPIGEVAMTGSEACLSPPSSTHRRSVSGWMMRSTFLQRCPIRRAFQRAANVPERRTWLWCGAAMDRREQRACRAPALVRTLRTRN